MKIFIAWMCSIVVLNGCSTITGYPETKVSELPSNDDSTFLLADTEYSAVNDTDTRNALIHKKMRDIDLAYYAFESDVFKENILTDLTTDVLVLGMSGGAVLSGSTGEKELLSALNTFLLGSKASYDKRALFENTMAILVQEMRADRAAVRNDLLKGSLLDIEQYTKDAAALDIARYYYVGTVPNALTGLAKVSAEQEAEAQEEADDILTKKFKSDHARDCLKEFMYPKGTKDVNNFNDVVSWWRNSEFADIPFGLMLSSSEGDEARIHAANSFVSAGKIDACVFN